MEGLVDVVIVGAGIAGLASALGLHRVGVRCLVLESSDHLRASGFAFTTFRNAWKALDALGIGDALRRQHIRLERLIAASTVSGDTTSQLEFGENEVRCTKRELLLETLRKELPPDTIRFSSKVVSIEEGDKLKLLLLADGSIIRTKVLIGCDGVNSVVATWLALKKPNFTPRFTLRGLAEFPGGHGFKPEFLQYFGDGFRAGFQPCDAEHMYWFFSWTPSAQEKELQEDPVKMKQLLLKKLGKVPEEVVQVIQRTDFSGVFSSQLRFRWPFDLLWGTICKGNVCLAGDALHAMTPDIGQGGCMALEDGVVLARCLGEAFLGSCNGESLEEKDKIKKGIEKYVKERRWRSFELISTAYVVGRIQQSNGWVMNFLRDKVLSALMAKKLLKIADFNCGKLPLH